LDLSGIPPEKRGQMSRQTDDRFDFSGTQKQENAKSAKIKSAVRKTEKHDRSADRQMTDLIFRDTVVHG
jgi:hypothetical protein